MAVFQADLLMLYYAAENTESFIDQEQSYRRNWEGENKIKKKKLTLYESQEADLEIRHATLWIIIK